MVTFDSDELQQEQEIDYVTKEVTDVFRHAEGILKQFSKQGDESSISTSERTVRNNMQRSLAKKLQGLSGSFRTSQKEYMTRLREQKNGSGDKGFDFLSETKKRTSLEDVDIGFNSVQMQVLDDTEKLVDERDQEINRIAQSIEELAQIFKELAVLVIDQGTVLDRIDFNMEQVLEHTSEGIVQLKKADDYQKGALPMRCVILLIVLIAIMLIVLIIKHQH